jgi:hypothetical protein
MASDQKVLLTVILHHDQAKNLDQILAHTKETGFYRVSSCGWNRTPFAM